MHIGDAHESITHDATARREAMVGQLRQMVERLNVAPGAAIPPAAVQADTVRISPEARRAMNSLASAEEPAGGASPRQVIEAIRAVLLAHGPEASAAATGRLAELVRSIVTTFPIRVTTRLQGYPIDDRAADLVRALLPQGGQPPPQPAAVAALVRALFAGQGDADAPPEATLQRAALAIFLASARIAGEVAAQPMPAPLAEAQARGGEFPPALMGHLVPPEKRVRVEPIARQDRRDNDHSEDGEPQEDSQSEDDEREPPAGDPSPGS